MPGDEPQYLPEGVTEMPSDLEERTKSLLKKLHEEIEALDAERPLTWRQLRDRLNEVQDADLLDKSAIVCLWGEDIFLLNLGERSFGRIKDPPPLYQLEYGLQEGDLCLFSDHDLPQEEDLC